VGFLYIQLKRGFTLFPRGEPFSCFKFDKVKLDFAACSEPVCYSRGFTRHRRCMSIIMVDVRRALQFLMFIENLLSDYCISYTIDFQNSWKVLHDVPAIILEVKYCSSALIYKGALKSKSGLIRAVHKT